MAMWRVYDELHEAMAMQRAARPGLLDVDRAAIELRLTLVHGATSLTLVATMLAAAWIAWPRLGALVVDDGASPWHALAAALAVLFVAGIAAAASARVVERVGLALVIPGIRARIARSAGGAIASMTFATATPDAALSTTTGAIVPTLSGSPLPALRQGRAPRELAWSRLAPAPRAVPFLVELRLWCSGDAFASWSIAAAVSTGVWVALTLLAIAYGSLQLRDEPFHDVETPIVSDLRAPGGDVRSRGWAADEREVHAFGVVDPAFSLGVVGYARAGDFAIGQRVVVRIPDDTRHEPYIVGMHRSVRAARGPHPLAVGWCVIPLALFVVAPIVEIVRNARRHRALLRDGVPALATHDASADLHRRADVDPMRAHDERTVRATHFVFTDDAGRQHRIATSPDARLLDERREPLLYPSTSPADGVLLGDMGGDPDVDDEGRWRTPPMSCLLDVVPALVTVVVHVAGLVVVAQHVLAH